MDDEPRRGGWIPLIVGKVGCCGGIVLIIAGVWGWNAIGPWLHDGGLAWLALAAVLAAAGVWLWRRQNRKIDPMSTARRRVF